MTSSNVFSVKVSPKQGRSVQFVQTAPIRRQHHASLHLRLWELIPMKLIIVISTEHAHEMCYSFHQTFLLLDRCKELSRYKSGLASDYFWDFFKLQQIDLYLNFPLYFFSEISFLDLELRALWLHHDMHNICITTQALWWIGADIYIHYLHSTKVLSFNLEKQLIILNNYFLERVLWSHCSPHIRTSMTNHQTVCQRYNIIVLLCGKKTTFHP